MFTKQKSLDDEFSKAFKSRGAEAFDDPLFVSTLYPGLLKIAAKTAWRFDLLNCAEDIAHEVVRGMLERKSVQRSYDLNRACLTWWWKTFENECKRVCKTFVASTRMIVPLEFDVWEEESSTFGEEHGFSRIEIIEIVREVVEELSAPLKFVVEFYYIDKQPVKEIATQLGITRWAVYHRLTKARRLMADLLGHRLSRLR